MLSDLLLVLSRRSVIHLLGVSRLRERYARSKLGQAWLSISQLLNILIFGSVWSIIWQQPIDAHLPYIGVGFIVYGLMATTLNEATAAIIADAQYYMNSKIPFLLSVLAHVYRNFLVFLYNIPAILILVIWSDTAVFDLSFMWLVGIFLCFILVVFWTHVIAVTSVRFRDLIQVYGILFQTAFLISPLMWKLEFVPAAYHNYFLMNPFAAGLEILRNPIIGIPVPSFAYLSLVVWCVLGIIASNICYRVLDRKLTLWL